MILEGECRSLSRLRVTKQKIQLNTDKHFKLYVFLCFIYIVGIIAGCIFFRMVTADNSIRMKVVDKYRVLIEITNENQNEILMQSLFQDLKLLIVFWVGGISVVGSPFLLLIFLFKGAENAFLISVVLTKLGFSAGNIFTFQRMFLFMSLQTLAIMLLLSSSFQLTHHIFNEKNSIRYEILRHSMMTIFAFFIFLFSSFLRANF